MTKRVRRVKALPVIGWREWVSLPDLGLDRIKAKIDTGARSSALHAINLHSFTRRGVAWVSFDVHPLQHGGETVRVQAELVDERSVRNPGGRSELRPVIHTTVVLFERSWEIDLTLTPRWGMGFRMLLGRQAVRNRFLVDPGRSFFGERDEIERRVRYRPTKKKSAAKRRQTPRNSATPRGKKR